MSNEVLSNEVQINEVLSNEVQINEVQKEVRFSESHDDSSNQSSDQELAVVESKSWFTQYEQFLYGTIVGGAAVIFSLSVRSLLRNK